MWTGVLFGSQLCALALKYDVLEGDAAWFFPVLLGTVTWLACLTLTAEPGWRELEGDLVEDVPRPASSAVSDHRRYGQTEYVEVA